MNKHKKSKFLNWKNNRKILKKGDIILFEDPVPPLNELKGHPFIMLIRNLAIMMTNYIIKERKIQDKSLIIREYIGCIQFIRDTLKSKGIYISHILEKNINN
jgi:hypothetical protein